MIVWETRYGAARTRAGPRHDWGGAVGNRLDNLQALRGVACLAVVVFHTAALEKDFGLGFSPLRPALWFGYAGVDLFFVLSGFIITLISRADLGRPARLPRYAFRRLWRIYPTYWAALVPAVGLFALSAPEQVVGPRGAAEWIDTVLLLPQPDGCRFLPVVWTLSYELMFYLAFGVLFLLPRRLALPLLGAWAVAVVVVMAGSLSPTNRFAALTVSPFVLEFLAGVAVAWFPVRLSGRLAAGVAAVAAAWFGVGSALAFDPDFRWLCMAVPVRVLVYTPAAALLVFAAVGWERAGGRVGWRWLSRVGDASYSIYLIHVPALIVAHQVWVWTGLGHRRLPHLGWIGLTLALGVGFGMLLHRFVERPLLRLAERRKPVAAQPPAAAPEPVRRAA